MTDDLEINSLLANIAEHADSALLTLTDDSGCRYYVKGNVMDLVGMAQSYLLNQYPTPKPGDHVIDQLMDGLVAQICDEFTTLDLFVTRLDGQTTFFFERGYGNLFARQAAVRYFLQDSHGAPSIPPSKED